MKNGLSLRFVPLLIFFVFLASFGGAFAVWQYAESDIEDVNVANDIVLVDFEYKPEEVLPGGDGIETPIGENHLLLIQEILNESSYGLNETKKPIIHNLLNGQGDVVYCDQNVQGGNLKHIMIDGVSESEKLYFVVEWVSDTEYNAYTLIANQLDGAIGSEIPVYKTVLVEHDGVWTADKSYFGYATIISPEQVSRAIDVTTWRESE